MNWYFILKNIGGAIGLAFLLVAALAFSARWIWLVWRRRGSPSSTTLGQCSRQALRAGLKWGSIWAILLLAIYLSLLAKVWLPAYMGSTKAQFEMGMAYSHGAAIFRHDPARAAWWFHKAAEGGSASAQFNFALALHNGEGVTRDDTKAVYWYQKAADQGDWEAVGNLGVHYAKGEGVPQDEAHAISLFEEAAEAGEINSIRKLGRSYWNGLELPQNDDKAVYWFKKGDKQGDLTCKYFLGIAYAEGRGVTKDAKTAADYFKAVEPTIRTQAVQGNVAYQRILGEMYLHGYGVPIDHNEAHSWLSKAAAQGDQGAADTLRSLDQH